MWFKLLMLVHLCVSFPLKCPEPAQWALRANGHCADPSKYFCLRDDLIKGYSENCTRSDFQQPGRKAVLRGGIDADVCSVERYQPFPIKFFTNTSTNCIFLRSFCNDEGQVVYEPGNRNTDTTCRCDYMQGYDFIVKPNNPCFCEPLQEDCSCYLKICSNTNQILSPDYQCTDKTDLTIIAQCRYLPDENGNSSRKPEINFNIPDEDYIYFQVPRNKHSAIAFASLFGGMIVVILVLSVTMFRRYLLRVLFFIDEPPSNITLYEGESFQLDYSTRTLRGFDIKKDGFGTYNRLKSKVNVSLEDGGLYYADSDGVRSKYTLLTVLPLTISGPGGNISLIEGQPFKLQYSLPTNSFRLIFLKNNRHIAETKYAMNNVFHISKVAPTDEGSYCAKVENIRSKITQLTVQSMFTSSFEQICCIEGEKLQLNCSVYSESIEVEWFKDNANQYTQDKIERNKTISIDHHGKDHVLTIQNAKIMDSGKYIIIAGNVRKQLPVTVKAFFQLPLKNNTIMEGLEVSFECEAEKPFLMTWFKDNMLIKDLSKFRIEILHNKVHKLTIRTTTVEDKGTYRIQMKDNTDITCCADLEVKEMPDAVKQMSDHDRNIFLKAAQSGTAVRYYIRIMIVGESRVGKTCLLRRLMKEQIDDVKSTDGIHIEVKQCKINRQTQKWIFTSDEDFYKTANQNEEFADCGFWDFAGQKEFYATHQTFLSTNAIYLLVVDISKEFAGKTHKDMIEDEFYKVGGN